MSRYKYVISIGLTEKQYYFLKRLSVFQKRYMTYIVRDMIEERRRREG